MPLSSLLGALSYTWHVQGSLHSCRPMICYVARTLLPKFPLLHFSRNAGSGWYWNRSGRWLNDWFLTLQWDTYLLSLYPSHYYELNNKNTLFEIFLLFEIFIFLIKLTNLVFSCCFPSAESFIFNKQWHRRICLI